MLLSAAQVEPRIAPANHLSPTCNHAAAPANGGLHVYENPTIMTAREKSSKGARPN